MAGSIYVCGFLKLTSLNKLIFGKFYIYKFDVIYIYIYMWIFKVGKFKYINIWQVLSQKKEKKEKKKAGCLE